MSTPERAPPRIHTFDSLRNREFLLLWLSILSTGAAFWTQMFVVGWLAYEITHSALLTSTAVGLQMAPFLIGGPLGGILADRIDRRRVLLAITGYQAVVMAAFAALVASGRMEIEHLFGFAVALGLATATAEPVRFSLVPQLVPRRAMVNAFALTNLAFGVARFVMPGVAGYLVLWIGPGQTVSVGVCSLLLAGSSIALMRLPDAARPSAEEEGLGPLRRFLDGLRYARRQPLILGSVLMGAAVPLLLMPGVMSLMPVYADRVFHVEADGLGILMAAVGIGGVVGVILVASAGSIRRKGRAMVFMLLLTALMTILYSQNASYPAAIALLVLLFMGMPSFWAIQNAAVQEVAPDHLRGRVASISSAFVGFYPLGSVVAGALAERFGPQAATLAAATAFLAVLIFLAIAFPSVWRYRSD